ncbi:MAG: PKD domain-containing protein, partial [Planctomycetota bacterium]
MRCKAIVITVFLCLNLGAIVQPGGCMPAAPLDDAFVDDGAGEPASNNVLAGDAVVTDQDNRPLNGGSGAGGPADQSSDNSAGGGQQVATLAASVSPPGGFAPATLTFRAVRGSKPDSGHVFEWEFGDGGSAVGAEVQHRYEKTGVFTVRVTQFVDGSVFNTQNLIVPIISDVTPTYTSNDLTVEFVAETDALQPWMAEATPQWDF